LIPQRQAKALNLHGLLAHWQDAVAAAGRNPDRLEKPNGRRSLERRIRSAHIAASSPYATSTDLPKCDRAHRALMASASSMTRQRHHRRANASARPRLPEHRPSALIQGHTVLFTSAGQMLAISPRQTAPQPCVGASAIMPASNSCDRRGRLPVLFKPHAICSSNSSAAAMSKEHTHHTNRPSPIGGTSSERRLRRLAH